MIVSKSLLPQQQVLGFYIAFPIFFLKIKSSMRVMDPATVPLRALSKTLVYCLCMEIQRTLSMTVVFARQTGCIIERQLQLFGFQNSNEYCNCSP